MAVTTAAKPSRIDSWIARPELWRPLVLASIALRVLFVIAPFDVLAPVDPWELGRLMWRGEVPYRDFAVEYPPAALLAFLLPGAVPRSVGSNVLALEMFALEASMLLLVRHSWDVVRRYLVLSIPMVPFLSGGFDALPMVALTWAAVLLSRQDARGWIAGAIGAAVKVFPGVVWGTSRRGLPVAALSLALCLASLVAPLAVADREDTPVGYHADRGTQNESVAASATFAAHVVSGEDTTYAYRFRSNEIDGAAGAANVTLVLFGSLAVAVGVVSLRRNRPSDIPRDALALVTIVLCGSKVLSPQFLLLGAPLAAVVGGSIYVHYLPIGLMTLVPFFVDQRRSDLFVGLAAVRNVIFVALAVRLAIAVLRDTGGPVDDADADEAGAAPELT